MNRAALRSFLASQIVHENAPEVRALRRPV